MQNASVRNGVIWQPYKTIAPCFLADTPILLPDGTSKPIELIQVGDEVSTFDGTSKQGRDALLIGTVRRVFGNITRKVIAIHYFMAGESHTIYHTPKHVMMTESGKFKEAQTALMNSEAFVGHSGELVSVASYEMIRFGTARGDELSQTIAAFKPVTGMIYMDEHGLALAPQEITGWQTYNFEVPHTHTYIAGFLRVHNTSIQDVIAKDLGGNYNPTNIVITEVGTDASGATVGRSAYVEDNNHQFWSFTGGVDANGNTYTYHKTVESLTGDNPIVRTVEDRTVQVGSLKNVSHSGTDASGNIFTEGFDALGTLASYVFKKPDGSQLSFSGDQLGGILGSSIGNAIGGKNFATKVVATTLIGSLGQTIGGLLNNITGGVSSLLVGELANAIGLNGFAAGAFTTVGTTITTQNTANDNGCVRLRNCG